MHHGERFNSWTHLVGAAFAIAGSGALVTAASSRADPWRIVSFSLYGATLVLVYVVSTLYHATSGPSKAFWRKMDHIAIYLLIAGSYTPFMLVPLRGAWGWSLFGTVWGLAALGIVQEIWIARGARVTSLVIYFLMGWTALVALQPLLAVLSWRGLAWLVAGGLVYSAGIVFYLYDERYRHWHGIWHLFVMAGSGTHYCAVMLFVA